jgi:hypothetical protein
MIIIISLSTIVSASVTNSRKGAIAKLEERLAQKATIVTCYKFTEYDIEFEKQRKTMREFQDQQFKIQSDVSKLKSDVKKILDLLKIK